LRKSYGGEEVVAGVSLDIAPGEIPGRAALNVLVLLAYAAAGFYAASVRFRRRLLK
jgi:hypothetical protein